jgi:hypothetical protein
MLTSRADVNPPSTSTPEWAASVRAKFDQLAQPVFGSARAVRIASAVASLEDLADVREMIALCARPEY